MVAYTLNFDNWMPKVNKIDVFFIFKKLDVGCFHHFGWFERILFSDYNQTIIYFFILGKVMDENAIFSWRLDTSEYPEIFFSPAKTSDLKFFYKM